MKIKQHFDLIIGYLLITFFYLGSILSLNSNPFSNSLPRHDSSMFMYFGKGMTEGLIPYVDMFDHKGIVLFWIEHLGITLGRGNDNLGIWIMESLFIMIALIFLIKTAKLLSQNTLVAGISLLLVSWVFVSAAQGGNFSEIYAFTFISVTIFYFAKYIIKDNLKSYEFGIVGLTGALTFFTRPNMIALWVVLCLYILISLLITKEFGKLLHHALWIFIGGVAICLAVVFYGLVVGNLKEMLYQTLILNVQYSSGEGFLSKIDGIRAFINFMNESYLLFFISISILLFVILKKIITKKESTLYYLTLIYTLLNFATVVMSGRYYLHYFVTMIPALFLLFGLTITWLSRIHNFKILWPVAMALLVFTININMDKGINKIINLNASATNQKVDAIDIHLSNYIKQHSDKSDTIYVHAITANIYLQSERFANSKFFVLPSLDYTQFPDLQNEFTNGLTNNPPLFIIVKKEVFESETLDEKRMNKTVVNFVKDRYEMIPDFKESDQMLFQLSE